MKGQSELQRENQNRESRRFVRFTSSAVFTLSIGALFGACQRPPQVHPLMLTGSVGTAVSSRPVEPNSTASSAVINDTSLAVKPSEVDELTQKDGTQGGDDAAQALPEPRYLVEIERPVNGGKSLSEQFANLQPWQCRDELRRRTITVRPSNMPAPGVATPLRLGGSSGPIRIVTPGFKSKYGILDCRLALLFDELAPRLAALSVKVVYVDNIYRPQSRLPRKRKSPSQHSYGLAVDITKFGMTDGTVLNVENDFKGVLGSPVCGPDAVISEATREAVLLRNIVCELARIGAFNYFLTPNYDGAHRNHLHGDIKRGSKDHVVR